VQLFRVLERLFGDSFNFLLMVRGGLDQNFVFDDRERCVRPLERAISAFAEGPPSILHPRSILTNFV
jgi:hypothetical protein